MYHVPFIIICIKITLIIKLLLYDLFNYKIDLCIKIIGKCKTLYSTHKGQDRIDEKHPEVKIKLIHNTQDRIDD